MPTRDGKPSIRGMNMRNMKARSMMNKEVLADGRAAVRARELREESRPPDADDSRDDELDLSEGEALAVDDDGTCRVRRGGGRRSDEEGSNELPSEPPPGWLDG